MVERIRISPQVLADVLTACERRCCLCFAFRSDSAEKKGQIAHLDRNPRNNDPSNLAFLCFDHHDQYDSKPSQSKGLTIKEVTHYRERLHEFVGRRAATIPSAVIDRHLSPETEAKVSTSSERSGKADIAWSADRYQTVATIYRGRYSTVRKCVLRDTGAVCVLKDTDASQVSLDALNAISALRCSGLAAPNRVWRQGDRVYEELPYVGGVRLSDAIVPGLGRMGGEVLEAFHRQMMTVIGELHHAGVLHRDIHPENIYLVTEHVPGWSKPIPNPTHHDHADCVGIYTGGDVLLIRFVLVDHTFAVLADKPSKVAPVVHGAYTSAEQALGSPTKASDLYALGATIYYAITGRQIPSFSTRMANPGALGELPSGRHGSRFFGEHLASLLALDQSQRPQAPDFLDVDTGVPGYGGILRISPSKFLITDSPIGAQLLGLQETLSFLRSLDDESGESRPEIPYWIDQLSGD